jgi:hypothetical protein
MRDINTDNVCPYCGKEINPPPQTKQNCPLCGKTVHVQRLCCDRQNAKRLMTDQQAEEEEIEWREWREEHLDKEEAERESLIRSMSDSKDPRQLKLAYLRLFLIARRSGADPMPFKRKIIEYQILEHKSSAQAMAGLQVEKPENDKRTGPQCDAMTGRVYSIEEALKERRIPCGPDCICSWEIVFDD